MLGRLNRLQAALRHNSWILLEARQLVMLHSAAKRGHAISLVALRQESCSTSSATHHAAFLADAELLHQFPGHILVLLGAF